ncbi:hypothetical protein E4U55_005674 [Claviceps digitariae]|nr:hypothetical protein E4U55_005674 [Claviceps digitariae]
MPPSKSPSLTRFLSNFTLGFSDGLTVPFALTTGLSSLGHTDTVIYAGLAELCAGSISMGIGGYLSARGEVALWGSERHGRHEQCSGFDDGHDDDDDVDGEEKGMLGRQDPGECESRDAKSSCSFRESTTSRKGVYVDEQDQQERQEAIIQHHLEPLQLPHQTTLDILTLLRNRPDGLHGSALRVQKMDHVGDLAATAAGMAIVRQNAHAHALLPTWPVVSGLSISLGYLVGGIIPLLPYLFAPTVGQGLQWSIAVCLLALLAFGFIKSWLLGGAKPSWRTGLWEAGEMLVLGGFAAGVAVLCVNLLGGDILDG